MTDLLLLQEHGVTLVRDTTDVQRVSAVGQDLAKVASVAIRKISPAPNLSNSSNIQGRIVLGVVLLNKTSQSCGSLGRAIVQCAECLSSLGDSRVDTRNVLQRLCDELGHAGRCELSAGSQHETRLEALREAHLSCRKERLIQSRDGRRSSSFSECPLSIYAHRFDFRHRPIAIAAIRHLRSSNGNAGNAGNGLWERLGMP